jgi:hypothetical protein
MFAENSPDVVPSRIIEMDALMPLDLDVSFFVFHKRKSNIFKRINIRLSFFTLQLDCTRL